MLISLIGIGTGIVVLFAMVAGRRVPTWTAVFHALAPTQTEPPFAIAQGLVLSLFIGLGVIAARRFRPGFATPALG